MPTVSWNPNGQNIAQVATILVTGVAVGGTLSAIINNKLITYTCVTGDTVITAATNWLALLNGSSVPPEFGEVDWTNPADATIVATASSPGTPFTLTKSQAGGATCTLTATRASSSESSAFNANNWLRSGVPALPQNGDDMVVGNSSVPILWDIDLLSGVLLNSYTRYQSFTGSIGLPEINPLGYIEYRPTYFQLGSNVANLPVLIGAGTGNGPSRERYNFNSHRVTMNVIAAGSPADAYAVRFLGSNGLNAITVLGTSVGIAMLPTEAFPGGATISSASVDGGGTLDLGPGCAFSGTGGGGTLTVTGGTCNVFCTPTSIVARNNATLTLSALNGTFANINCTNGVQVTTTVAMTISVLTLAKSSNLNNSNNLGAITVTTSTIDGDTCQVQDPNNTITWTNATTILGQVTAGPITFTGSRTLKVT